MKSYWLLPSFLGLFLFSLPAQAAKLLTWRFDTNQNKLMFTTDSEVQPKVQIFQNPTRAIVDLPDTTLDKPTVTQPLKGAISSLRVGQFENKTTRLVIELNSGYTLDPSQVAIKRTASQWSLQLPTPKREELLFVRSPMAVNLVADLGNASSNRHAQVPTNQLAIINSVELSNNGSLLIIRADGKLSPVKRWDAATGMYRITFPSTQLADRVTGPLLNANSPLVKVRIQEQDQRTVQLLVQPASGVQVGDSNQLSDRFVAFQLQRGSQAIPTPITTPTQSAVTVIPVPAPERTTPQIEPITPPQSFPPQTNPSPARNQRIVVVVDPGHGGKDPGAIGVNRLREVDVILPIAKQVAALLERQGVQVVMTRNADYFVDLAPRVDIARRVGADLFVSIHANAIVKRPDVSGLETYYYSSGRGLAQTIHNSVLQNVNVRNRGVRQARFYVLRRSSMPAVLVEVGYVTSPEESARLANPNYQSQMADAIARGVLQYIQQNIRK